ncbi:MAG TPA: EscU/YscU/HrcU family type III secretion system export apparatus switch protein, partial [Steroidobacteraceae bacterium]|nr:EscU/YscU/HrcU family type III secretion system export apparatus switch protein [Steroidobacteraceae bacterium]
ALKSVIKLGFFGAIVFAFMLSSMPGMMSLNEFDSGNIARWVGDNALTLLFRLGIGLLLVGVLDLAYVRWQFKKQMMMSRREIKEEVKRREGDPQIRAKIRELQRENLKQARSLGKLPDADVLITNPTHLGVALRYDRDTMSAPIVLAKGSDYWVTEMKTIARQNNIPIIEHKKLARTLFKYGALDRPIPERAYVDVARVYAELAAWRRRTGRYEVTT